VATIAQRTGRHFVHLDLSKKYCEIASERVAVEMKQLHLDELEPGKSEIVNAAASVAKSKY
jgi:hypothetical protein